MICPKCNSECRSKMTGAICLNNNCNWTTHNVNNIKVINNEVNNSVIAKKLREEEINEILSLLNDHDEFYGL